MKTSKSVTKLFVEDYQIQHGLVNENEKVNDEVGEKFRRSSFRLFSLFTFDFIMCQVIIGELSVKKRDQNLKSSSLMYNVLNNKNIIDDQDPVWSHAGGVSGTRINTGWRRGSCPGM